MFYFIDSSTNEITLNKSIVFGLNATLRALNQDAAIEILLISADIKPRFIVEQIIFQALTKNEAIIILCVPKMCEHFKKFIKFSCLSLIILKSSESTTFANSIEWMKELSKRYPIKNALAKSLKKINFYSKTGDEMVDTKPLIISKKRNTEPNVEIDFSELYLQKPNSSERSFVPDKIATKQSQLKSIEPMNNLSDYISFNDDDIEMNTEESSKQSNNVCANVQRVKTKKKKSKNIQKSVNDSENLFNYVTLRVNKIQGNPNKRKKNKK